MEEMRQIPSHKCQKLSLKYHYIFEEYSSIINININKAFQNIIEKTYY